jgi:hypothetical protein
LTSSSDSGWKESLLWALVSTSRQQREAKEYHILEAGSWTHLEGENKGISGEAPYTKANLERQVNVLILALSLCLLL